MSYFVYILTNYSKVTLYIGVTNNLERRVYEHRSGLVDSFSKKYKLTKIVYYEEYKDVNEAIRREKQIKNWHRQWKINLIKEKNPNFNNLLDAETSSA